MQALGTATSRDSPWLGRVLSHDTSISPVPFNLQVGSTGSQVTSVHLG
jgi:hypothetical protein